MVKQLCMALMISAEAYAFDWRYIGEESSAGSLFFIDIARLKPGQYQQLYTTLQIQKFPARAEEGGTRSVITDMVADCDMKLTALESAKTYDSKGQLLSNVKPRDIVFTRPASESMDEQWLRVACAWPEVASAHPISVDPVKFALEYWQKQRLAAPRILASP